jgi:hypothetical protein
VSVGDMNNIADRVHVDQLELLDDPLEGNINILSSNNEMDVDEKTEELLLRDSLLNEINSNLNLYSVLGSGTNNNFSQVVNFKVDNTVVKMEIDTGAIVTVCTERSF